MCGIHLHTHIKAHSDMFLIKHSVIINDMAIYKCNANTPPTPGHVIRTSVVNMIPLILYDYVAYVLYVYVLLFVCVCVCVPVCLSADTSLNY